VRLDFISNAVQFTSKLVLLNWSYLKILTLDVDNLNGVVNLIQRATKSYFMKIFQIQRLLCQNRPSRKIQKKTVSRSSVDFSVDAHSIKDAALGLHTKS
jgi:hypothetical protein